MKKVLLLLLFCTSLSQRLMSDIPATAPTTIDESPFAIDNLGDGVEEAVLKKTLKESASTTDDRLVISTDSKDLETKKPLLNLKDEKVALATQVAEKEEQENREYFLNFENTALSTLVNYVGDLMGYTIVPDKGIENSKVSLQVREPLTASGVWKVFLTLLDMANFAIVEIDGIYKIVPRDAKHTEPLPAYINVSVDNLPDSDITIRYVTTLRNIPIGEVQDLLGNLLSAQAKLLPQPSINGFIISDKSMNIKSAMRILQELDQSGLQEQVVVMPLKRVNSADAKKILDSLRNSPENSPIARLFGRNAEQSIDYFSPTTKIIAEDRRNLLILLGNIKSIKKIEDFVKEHIDTELKGTKSPFRLYEFQYADAQQVAQILNDVVNAQPDSSAGQQAAKYGGIRGGVKYFKPMSFQVDTTGNRLISTCVDDQDWELLKKTIHDLDKPQPQVAIETFIVTINIDDKKGLGGQLRNKFHNQLFNGIDVQTAPLGTSIYDPNNSSPTNLLGNLIKGLGSLQQGTTAFTFGKPADGMWGVFQALNALTNTSILQKPFLTVSNRSTATIDVGSTQQVISSTAIGDTGTQTPGYTEKKVGSTLSFTPQINTDGVISLKIDTTLSDFVVQAQSNYSTTVKKLKTNVSVASGQVLVLGGFVKTSVNETSNETPLLGRIPIAGWLFKNKKRTVAKDYVFYFICPTIIKPRTEPGVELYTKIKLHEATKQVENASEVSLNKDVIHNWFFNRSGENYHHKVIDFANARYQPTTVDIKNDPFYRDEGYFQSTAAKKTDGEIKEEVGEEPDEVFIEDEEEVIDEPQVPLFNSLEQKVATREKKEESVEAIEPIPQPLLDLKPIELAEDKRNQLKELLARDTTPLPSLMPPSRENMKQLLSSQPKIETKKVENIAPEVKPTPVGDDDAERVKEAMRKLLASSRQAYN